MLTIETHEAVRVIRMEHGKANAFDLELLNGLLEAFEESERDDTRAIVLTGTGRIFSAGLDLFRILDADASYLEEFFPLVSSGFLRLAKSPLPVVAAVNGHAIAGGCVTACACDHRVMADGDGKMGMTELRVGLPIPVVALEIVRAVVAPEAFAEVIALAQLYSPQESLKRGLVTELAAPEEVVSRALERAAALATIDPPVYALTKRQLRAPMLERIASDTARFDREIEQRWKDPGTLDGIRSYLSTTVGKKE